MYLDDIDDPLENFLPQRHQGSVPHARRVQQAGGDVQLLGFLQPKGMPGLKWTNFEERNPIFFERQTCGNLMMLDLVAKLYDGNKGCTSYFAGRWQRLVWLTSDICFDLNIACSRVCFLVLRKSCFTGLWLFPQALFPQMSWGKTMKSWMRIIASMRAQFDSICLLFVFNSATAGQLLFGWYALWLQGPFALDSARWSFFFFRIYNGCSMDVSVILSFDFRMSDWYSDCFHSFVNVQQVLLHIIKVLEQNTDSEAWMLVCQMNSDQLTLVLCQKHRGWQTTGTQLFQDYNKPIYGSLL